MKSVIKVALIGILFSIGFYFLRTHGFSIHYNVSILISDLGGLVYLYSTVGMIFAVFAAFVVVSEAQDWNMLVNAAKNEVGALSEIWLWSEQLSEDLKKKYKNCIEGYLENVINDEWARAAQGQESSQTSESVQPFHNLISKASTEDKELGRRIFSAFTNLLSNRSTRLELSYEPLPKILKFTVTLVATALIVLSLLIGVRDAWLDYVFLLSIVILVSIILLVINDLDNPLDPGEWYLKPKMYQELLSQLRSRNA